MPMRSRKDPHSRSTVSTLTLRVLLLAPLALPILGCQNAAERAVHEANLAGREESIRAGRQRRAANRVIQYEVSDWDSFERVLENTPLGRGTAVVAYPLRLVDPTPEQLDRAESILRSRGFEQVIQHHLLTARVIILRE